jgi:hypothetical protein
MLLLWIRVGFNGHSSTPWSCGDGDGVVDGGDFESGGEGYNEALFKGCPLR